MHWRKTVLVLALFLVFAGFASGEFSAVSKNGIVTVCRGSAFAETVFIENTGPADFTIAPSPWSAVYPMRLKARGNSSFVHVISPPPETQSGLYSIDTLVRSGKGAQKLTQTVRLISCPAELTAETDSFANCPCTGTVYRFVLKNTGSFADTYDLYVNAASYSLSETAVSLAPKNSRTVYATVTECGGAGLRAYMLTAVSRATGLAVQRPFFLTVQDCADYEVSDSVRGSYCSPQNITVTIANTGEAADTYVLNVSLGSPREFNLSPGESARASYYANESAAVTVAVDAQLGGDSSYQKELRFSDCAQRQSVLRVLYCALFVLAAAVVAVLFYLKWPSLIWMFLAIIAVVAFCGLPYMGTAWQAVVLYRLYIIAGILVFLLLYALFRQKPIGFLAYAGIVVGVAAVFLLLSLCFFAGYCRSLGIEFGNNATQETVVANDTTLILAGGKPYELDLSSRVLNPDNDHLTLSATPVENITVETDGLRATLTPERGFLGERVINFIVDDGRGGRAVSPDIRLVVAGRGLYRMNYLLAGFFLAAIAIIFLVLFTQGPRKKRILVRKKKN